jgi:hypothetical protein
MKISRVILCLAMFAICGIASLIAYAGPDGNSAPANLVANGNFETPGADSTHPAHFELTGNVEARYLGNPAKDISGRGAAFQSAKQAGSADAPHGAVTQDVTEIDAKAGRWFRFSFRGLPEDQFAVEQDGLYMKVEFFGNGGKSAYDGKVKKIYAQIEQARHDLAVNGDRKVGGAAVWQTYSMDFMLPFPQVDQVRLSIGFDHGSAASAAGSEFFITDFSLIRTEEKLIEPATAASTADASHEKLIPIGGRWFYKPLTNETQPPKLFDATNVDRLLYHDGQYSAPFAGMTTAWLRAGDKDAAGKVVDQDEFIADNVTISFDAGSMIIHSRGLPNHPTGKFPETGVGRGNPNYITEKKNTFYIPLDPKVNAKHIVTAADNSNHALPMGPIGVAVNGVVFFNPFDAGSQDASNMMDRCCGHPAPDGTYHYHKYPICINSPWMDDGAGHSPLIGWAFDGFPVYGPYEKANVMAKDLTGEAALNEFNLHFDPDRGWHYHVTPGKFPYIIGGYWGTEEPRDVHRGGPGGRRPGGPGGPGMGPPPGGPGGPGFGPPGTGGPPPQGPRGG